VSTGAPEQLQFASGPVTLQVHGAPSPFTPFTAPSPRPPSDTAPELLPLEPPLLLPLELLRLGLRSGFSFAQMLLKQESPELHVPFG